MSMDIRVHDIGTLAPLVNLNLSHDLSVLVKKVRTIVEMQLSNHLVHNMAECLLHIILMDKDLPPEAITIFEFDYLHNG